MLVREVMSTTPVTVSPDTPVKLAMQRMTSAKISSVPVVGAAGRLRGIVSEADVIRDRASADPRLHEIPHPEEPVLAGRLVADVMTTMVLTVGPDDDLLTAVDLFTSTAVKSLPVVDRNQRVLGMLSRSDVVRLFAEADADIERDVDAALLSAGLHDWEVEVHDGAVDLAGPQGEPSSDLARILASTVPGVTSVTVRSD